MARSSCSNDIFGVIVRLACHCLESKLTITGMGWNVPGTLPRAPELLPSRRALTAGPPSPATHFVDAAGCDPVFDYASTHHVNIAFELLQPFLKRVLH